MTPVNQNFHDQAMAEDNAATQMEDQCLCKYFTLTLGTSGQVAGVDECFRDLGLQKEQNLEECDLILTLCPVVAVKPAVKMLNTLPGKKPAVLMVLHSRRDPKDFKPDSVVTRQNMITVDCLFFEDQGLLQCTENDEALATILTWLSSEERLKRTPRKWPNEGLRINHKYFSLITGNPLNHDVNIERNLVEIMPNLQRVNNLEESDIILHFCFVESRAGTDIGAAGKMLSALAGKKPAVLMVLHSRRDPKDFKPDSVVTRQNMITVDCLFFEDQGLLQCTENDEALATILTWLSSEERLKRTPRKWPTDNFSFHRPMKPSLNYFTLISGKALGQDLKIERKLQEQNPDLRKVQNLEESDLILVFCPVVSRAGTDIEAAVKMINTKAGHKAAVLLVLHHTFDPHHIVPDSKRAVNREKTIAVDCLFHEDQGFLTCSQNQDALSLVGKWLRVCKK